MPYGQLRGRRPFERASKIAHAEIVKNPLVQSFLETCVLPEPPEPAELAERLVEVPASGGDLTAVVAIDGGLNETWVRPEYPSASMAFIALGPLLLYLSDLSALDAEPFIGPEDMQRLKKIERYALAVPTRSLQVEGCATFSQGVRRAIHDFLAQDDGSLNHSLEWLLTRGWRNPSERQDWVIPQCPNCGVDDVVFRPGDPAEKSCAECGGPQFLSDALRLYERIDDELGASGVLAYLLTALEQIVLVYVIRSVWLMKPELLREILFVKDGPLAFFGTTAPLYRPMRDLMKFLAEAEGGPLLNLVGLEKSGPFVEHAALIEEQLPAEHALVLDNEYIYQHIVPGDPASKEFGKNTYYGAKVIYRGNRNDTYVATIPTADYMPNPSLDDLINGPAVLTTIAQLRCSMYDNALIPVVLANRLVSLADVPSSKILEKFARDKVK